LKTAVHIRRVFALDTGVAFHVRLAKTDEDPEIGVLGKPIFREQQPGGQQNED
jgi:hypothetical protein